MLKNLLPYLFGLVIALALLLAPRWLSPYGQSVLVTFTINMILVCGYRLIAMTGSWSFAHVALMGIGGYVLAIATTAASPWSFWSALAAAPAAGGIAAAILAYPVLRTRQHLLASGPSNTWGVSLVELIDLSQPISHRGPARPFHPTPSIWTHVTHEETRAKVLHGDISFQTKGIILCDHTSTHVDAPCHYDPSPEAPSIDELPLELF